MQLKHHQYFTYIITNLNKTVLYTGVTNNLPARIAEHYFNQGKQETFAGKYNCFYLLYFKSFQYIEDAIAWEKRIKGWNRKKKEELILTENPQWKFLNEGIMEWPPEKDFIKDRRNK